MTTIDEDLQTLITAQWGLGSSPAVIVHVFMKTDPDETRIEPPQPSTNSVVMVIVGTSGIPYRSGERTDKWLYEGTVIISGITYNNVRDSIQENKRIGDDLSKSSGDLSMNKPIIEGDVKEDHFLASQRFNWLRYEARGS